MIMFSDSNPLFACGCLFAFMRFFCLRLRLMMEEPKEGRTVLPKRGDCLIWEEIAVVCHNLTVYVIRCKQKQKKRPNRISSRPQETDLDLAGSILTTLPLAMQNNYLKEGFPYVPEVQEQLPPNPVSIIR